MCSVCVCEIKRNNYYDRYKNSCYTSVIIIINYNSMMIVLMFYYLGNQLTDALVGVVYLVGVAYHQSYQQMIVYVTVPIDDVDTVQP